MTIFFSVYPIELDYESIFKSLRILGIDYCIQANWKTKYDVRNGLRKTIQYFKEIHS